MRQPVHSRPRVSARQDRAFGYFRFAEKVFLLGFSLILGDIRLAQQYVDTGTQPSPVGLKAIQRSSGNEVFQQLAVQPEPARTPRKIKYILKCAGLFAVGHNFVHGLCSDIANSRQRIKNRVAFNRKLYVRFINIRSQNINVAVVGVLFENRQLVDAFEIK